MAEWFEGGVPEAIVAAKQKGGVLIVYLAGVCVLAPPSEHGSTVRRAAHGTPRCMLGIRR